MVVFLFYRGGNGGRNKIGIRGFATVFFCLGYALIKGYLLLEEKHLTVTKQKLLKIVHLEEQNQTLF